MNSYLQLWGKLAAGLKSSLSTGVIVILLVGTGLAAQSGPRLNFASYEVSLYDQVVGRMRSDVLARIEAGGTARERFFIIPFAYENRGNHPEFSHSFITFVRVFGRGERSNPRSELLTGTYKGWRFEAFNISWIPHDFVENPHLCVFSGFGARLFPESNRCPDSIGKNFSLKDTLTIAANAKVAVGMWGPYEVSKGAFDLGLKRKHLLDGGTIKYRADDRLTRKDRSAINCFHAMGSLDEPFPNGGAFGTGFKMWGLNGTSRVLIEYRTRANRRGLLLQPVDVKRDRYGFVYAPTSNASRAVYNPFHTASAYGR